MISAGFFASPAAAAADAAAPAEAASVSRPSDGATFPAVLFALASIGTPLHALPTPTPAGLVPDESSGETAVLFLGDCGECLAGDALETGEGSDDPPLMVELVWGSRPGDPRAASVGFVGRNAPDATGLSPSPAESGPTPASGSAEMFAPTAGNPSPSDAVLAAAGGSVEGVEPDGDFGARTAGLRVAAGSVGSLAALQEAPAPAVGVAAAAAEGVDTVTLDGGMLRGMSRDFVPRLERVAERMWEEHGLRIDVVEGYRSQSRQDALFAQGRTAGGPVVTWTRQSLHTTGGAADVYVDGAPVTPQQAVLLSRVAAEEGLRTLYPYDSGHIQMDGARHTGPDIPGDHSLPERRGLGGPETERGVARIAPVARPARPPRPGGVVMAEPTIDSPAISGADGGDVAPAEEGARSNGSGRAVAAAEMVPSTPPVSRDLTTRPIAAPERAAPAPGPDLESVSGGTQYRRLHLPIDGVGGTASLDLGIRPGFVDASLNIGDPVLASDLRRNLHELRQTLTERGMDPRGLNVRVADVGSSDATGVRLEAGQSSRSFADAGAGHTAGDGDRGRAERFEQRLADRDDTRSKRGHPKHEEGEDGPDR